MVPSWLHCHIEPFDRCERSAKFPYSRYTLIESEADCLGVIQDETERWSAEFRPRLSGAACRLIALINRSHRFQTTHTVIGSEDPKKIAGYEWATASLGVAVTIMFREPRCRFDLSEHVRLVQWLSRVFSNPPFAGDPKGWLLGLWPEIVLHEDGLGKPDIRAFGVEIRAAAFASSEARCAERLTRMLDWISELLSRAANEQSESALS